MDKLWEHLDGILFVIFVFGGWVIGWVATSAMKNWRRVRESEHLAALKQTMIERGMSVDDIERVINAGRENQDLEKEHA